jgi:hypothetical protein
MSSLSVGNGYGTQGLIPPGVSVFDAFMDFNGLDKFVMFVSWAFVVVVATVFLLANYGKYKLYREANNDAFAMMEEGDKAAKLAEGAGGNSLLVAAFLWILMLVMSVNIFLSF